jgi:hypothetical protein
VGRHPQPPWADPSPEVLTSRARGSRTSHHRLSTSHSGSGGGRVLARARAPNVHPTGVPGPGYIPSSTRYERTKGIGRRRRRARATSKAATPKAHAAPLQRESYVAPTAQPLEPPLLLLALAPGPDELPPVPAVEPFAPLPPVSPVPALVTEPLPAPPLPADAPVATVDPLVTGLVVPLPPPGAPLPPLVPPLPEPVLATAPLAEEPLAVLPLTADPLAADPLAATLPVLPGPPDTTPPSAPSKSNWR